MRHSKFLLTLSVAVLAVLPPQQLTSLAAERAPAARISAAQETKKAIDFSFVNTKGRAIRLTDYRGKWVLVNFWAPWCPRCRAEFPDLNMMATRKDLVVIGVAMDYGPDQESATQLAEYLKFVNVMGGSRKDADNASRQVGPVDMFPVSYLYDRNGEIVAFLQGSVDENRVQRTMQLIEDSRHPETAQRRMTGPMAALLSTWTGPWARTPQAPVAR